MKIFETDNLGIARLSKTLGVAAILLFILIDASSMGYEFYHKDSLIKETINVYSEAYDNLLGYIRFSMIGGKEVLLPYEKISIKELNKAASKVDNKSNKKTIQDKDQTTEHVLNETSKIKLPDDLTDRAYQYKPKKMAKLDINKLINDAWKGNQEPPELAVMGTVKPKEGELDFSYLNNPNVPSALEIEEAIEKRKPYHHISLAPLFLLPMFFIIISSFSYFIGWGATRFLYNIGLWVYEGFKS